ncbi:energy-coupling factor transporter transmembrane component T [Peptococcaceae bacterium 1198_IL3148]
MDEQNNHLFLQTLHPAAVLAYTGSIFLLALMLNHPLYFALLLFILWWQVQLLDGWAAYKVVLLFSLTMFVMVALINLLFNKSGSTVFFDGPTIPIVGHIAFTVEAAVYSILMSMRLLLIMTVFYLYNRMVNPDRAFAFFARFAPRSAMLISLSTRLIPYLAGQLKHIKEVQQTRGVVFKNNGIVAKVKSHYPLLKVLLLSALDNAFNLAEAIHSRGYGCGSRTCYNSEKYLPRDVLVLVTSVACLLAGMLLLVKGWAELQIYPVIGLLIVAPEQVFLMAIISLLLLTPSLLNWGWQHWPYLKWRI